MAKPLDLFGNPVALITLEGLIVLAQQAGVPTDSIPGYAIGALSIDVTNANLYINAGTAALSTWKLVTRAA